jgi:nitrogen fixation protein NifZ
MMCVDTPRYKWGQRVQAANDLFNDGSYPEQSAGALLVREGAPGEIVQVGKHVESGAVVYMVEFALNCVVGCMEPELLPQCCREESF